LLSLVIVLSKLKRSTINYLSPYRLLDFRPGHKLRGS